MFFKKIIKYILIMSMVFSICQTISAQTNGVLPPLKNNSEKSYPNKTEIPRTNTNPIPEQLTEIIKSKGYDYVLKNFATITKSLNDNDNIRLASTLLLEVESEGAQKILNTLADKGNISAISTLAKNYGTGKVGFQVNISNSSKWIRKLEFIASSSDYTTSSIATGALCDIYQDHLHINYDRVKAKEYCVNYYEYKGGSKSGYASKLLNSDSPLYDPNKGLDLYQKCITEGDIYCKMNFGFQGRSSPDIAKYTSKSELFNYANVASTTNNSIALNNLAVDYLYGFGTEKNTAKAVEMFKTSAKSRTIYAYYNLLTIAFLKYHDISDVIKDKDDALAMISYYEYLSAANDKDDVQLMREWLSLKNRMPYDQYEFISFLEDKSKRGDAAASCALGDIHVHHGDIIKANNFAYLGLNTSNPNVKRWCEKVTRRVEVLRRIKS